MDLGSIRQNIGARRYFYTLHALERLEQRLIEPKEIEEAAISGEIIEEYPSDKYGPSCLIYGKTSANRHLHIQCSVGPTIWIITTYEPDPDEWVNFRVRR